MRYLDDACNYVNGLLSPQPTNSPQFGDDSDSNSDNESSDSLPYPEPLPRSDFLSQNFSATEYLSSLQNRHQTLEDLRSELRSRSQQLNQQLLDLVNSNYQDFLGLGSSLKGGDEKVEEIRVGLLGFQKDVEGIRTNIEQREEDVKITDGTSCGIPKPAAKYEIN